jgi:sulfite reductase (NADPH) hemoprotein beta-component
MYQYDSHDHALVQDRVAQFRDQVARRLTGELTEEQFRPLRLMNGLYLQLHAYMLRVAIPYGLLSATQLRKLAHIARTYDRGYGHVTTRQNVQFNWPRLEDTPDILAELASVEMHAIQTSGNCIRNITADPHAGAAADEVEDSRVWAEIIRQWSTLHPEFSSLPRKFKIAVSGSPADRTAARVHDIGLVAKKDDAGVVGFEVMVGGGLGRTPMIGKKLHEFLPQQDLLSYLEAILRVYNLYGRRDNKYKARIKILVHEVGIDKFRNDVAAEWQRIKDGALKLPDAEIARIRAFFAPPAFETLDSAGRGFEVKRFEDRAFSRWVTTSVSAHAQPGYAIVTLSLKPTGGSPGDITADQMDAVADLADEFGLGEIRATHEQNLVLAHVKKADLHALWQRLDALGLATPNISLAGDIICCPGLDFCNLANARSIPVAQRVSNRFADLDLQAEIGELKIKMSGCINACGHHHVANIGILGVDKKGEELYQITLGGRADEDASIGKIVGPAFAGEAAVDAIETIIETYVTHRQNGERFIETFDRIGLDPFKETLYGTA